MADRETEGDCRRLVQSGVNTTAEIGRRDRWWILSAYFCRYLLESRREGARHPRSIIWLWCILLGAFLGLASCRSIRPMVKIGLLAPFEGWEVLAMAKHSQPKKPVKKRTPKKRIT